MLLGPDGIVDHVAGPVRAVLGVAATKMTGTPLVQHVSSEDADRITDALTGILRGARDGPTVFRLAADPSRWCALEPFGTRRSDDRPGWPVVRVWDVTEHQRIRMAHQESDELLRALANAAPVAIVVEDRYGRVIMWSAAAERMFGWHADEVLHGPNPLVPPAATEQHANLRRRVLDGATFTGLSVQRRTKDAANLTTSLSVAPLASQDGRPRGVVEILSDITERLEVEQQLRQAQKMDAVGRLAGGIAHDFNNVMTAIAGYAGLLTTLLGDAGAVTTPVVDDGSAPEPSLGVAVAEMHNAIDHATRLTQSLLAFSRQQVMHPNPLDLRAVLDDLRPMLKSLVGERIGVVLHLDDAVECVCADRTQVEQVILNLVVNARDAMPDGGEIVVEATNVELDDRYARRRFQVIPGRYVLLTVSDDGCGMDEQTRSHAFEPFFTTKAVGQGTGLGLSTTYGIVKQSGGYVWVYSEIGIGTSVKVYLPRVGVEAAGTGDATAGLVKPGRQGTETVLVVEDEERVRVLVREVLTQYGYRVLEAAHGEAALEIAQHHAGPIHLMLTDVIMPGMSVRDMIAHLGRHRAETRVLCMSGYTNLAAIRHGHLPASVAFLPKPFAPDALAAKVRHVLDAQSSVTTGTAV